MATRQALCCVCDHEHFIGSILHFLLRKKLVKFSAMSMVLLVVVPWELFHHYFISVWRLKNQQLCRCGLFLVLAFWRLFVFSLNSEIDMRAFFVPVHCYHASVFPVLVPRMVASGFSEQLQNMATLSLL